jgi:hypothetical protein
MILFYDMTYDILIPPAAVARCIDRIGSLMIAQLTMGNEWCAISSE